MVKGARLRYFTLERPRLLGVRGFKSHLPHLANRGGLADAMIYMTHSLFLDLDKIPVFYNSISLYLKHGKIGFLRAGLRKGIIL